jgi:hypothetical protein
MGRRGLGVETRRRMAARRFGTLAAAITLVIVLAMAPSAGAYVPRQPDSFFGVSSPNFYVMNQKGQSALLDSYLNHISDAGVGWVRDAVPWPDAEPTPPVAGNHTYRWGTFDSQVTRFAQHGLTIQPVIRQTPLWAESAEAIQANCGRDGLTSAAGASDYGAFVGAYLRRYGRGGTFWAAHPGLPYEPVIRVELWNEPNWYPFACPGPDPERYAAMVAAGADAAHAVDPGVVVSIGGLVALKANTFSGSTLRGLEVGEFLKRMTMAVPSLPNKVDAVAIHLYDLDPDGDISLLGWLRSKMAAAGLGAESILVTEYGWHTQGGADSVPEALRAPLETAFANQAPRLNCGVIGIAPHAWVTSEQDTANRENWWGIADPADGSPYPTGQAYADQVHLFEGTGNAPAPRRTIPVCNRPLPDTDGDGTPDQNDDYPLDASRQSGSGEAPGDPAPPAPPTDPPRVGSAFFGAMAGSSFSDIRSRRAQADSMQNGQIGTSREVVDWQQIQSRENTDLSSDAVWADMDSRFLRLGLRGVRVLPTFTDAPAWASPSAPATTQADFADFLKAFAQRYGRGGIFWQRNRHLDESNLAVRDYEIWDRGNLSQSWWDGSASAAEYAPAYAQARAALDQVDPAARALVSLDQGGVNYAGFVRDMVAARPDLAGNVDGAFVLAGTSRTTPAVENVIAGVRSELDDTGNALSPIEVGFGWYTSGAGAMTEAERAVFYGQVADRLARSDCGVGGLLARSWVTPQNDLSNASAWYGLVDPQSFQLGATALALRDTARTYLGYGPNAAPRAVVHTCFRQAPDADGDGVPDAAEDYPLDPSNAVADANFPLTPSIDTAPNEFSGSLGATFHYSASGAASYWCTLDGGKPVVCDPSGRSYQNLSPGQHTFTVRGLDSLGLVGPSTSYTWTIDNTDPNTVIESHPDATLLTDTAQFSFSSNEGATTFLCRLDSAGYQSCDSPITLNGLDDGSHTFRVAAVDRAGNGDATPDAFSFEVHTIPTAPTITSGPANGAVTSSTPSFGFDARYASRYQCSFDSGDFRRCSDGQADTPGVALADGPHTFRVRGIGYTGTPGPATTRSFTVDARPPQTTITAGPSGQIDVPNVQLAFSASEPGSGFYCRLDTGPWRRCDGGTYSARDLREGAHAFRVVAVDRVGNQDPTPDARSFTVNTTPSIAAAPAPGAVTGPRPTFRFSSPSAAFFQCRFDANRYRRCSGANLHTAASRLSSGPHTFRVRGVTASGRISPAAVRQFKVDATAPVVTFPRPPQVNSQSGSTTVTFRASDLSKVVSTACSLDARAWARCTSPVTYRALSAGTHRVRVRATDKWGNVSAPKQARWQQPPRS